MAAVLTPRLHDPRRAGRPRPALRLVEGGRSPRAITYRRRRVVAVLLLGAVLVAVWSLVSALWPASGAVDGAEAVVVAGPGGAATAEGAAVPAPVATQPAAVVVVQPGDTLWSIAADLHPGGDLRPLVDELAERAGGGSLQVGQRIPVDGLVAHG